MIQLEPREKRVVIGGAVAVTVVLAYLLWPSGGDQSNVELVPADQRPAPAAPQPVPVIQASPPSAAPAAVPAAPSAATEGLVLHGVMAGGAILGFANGTQHYIPVGREVIPGLRLQAVRLHHAILASSTVTYRLGFGGPAVALSPPVQGTAVPIAAAAPAAAFTPAGTQRQTVERADRARLRQALAPRQVNGRIAGYTLRPGISIPVLEQAGLRPGDTILTVNGGRFGPEQLEELARTLANATRTELEVERGGRRIRLAAGPRR